ncbi:MAG: hypothetical protein V4613_01400 [Bacteroidota bacterium]
MEEFTIDVMMNSPASNFNVLIATQSASHYMFTTTLTAIFKTPEHIVGFVIYIILVAWIFTVNFIYFRLRLMEEAPLTNPLDAIYASFSIVYFRYLYLTMSFLIGFYCLIWLFDLILDIFINNRDNFHMDTFALSSLVTVFLLMRYILIFPYIALYDGTLKRGYKFSRLIMKNKKCLLALLVYVLSSIVNVVFFSVLNLGKYFEVPYWFYFKTIFALLFTSVFYGFAYTALVNIYYRWFQNRLPIENEDIADHLIHQD